MASDNMNYFIVGDYLYRGSMEYPVASVRRFLCRKNMFTALKKVVTPSLSV